MFIAKLDPFGRLLYSTFLGGPGYDVAGRIRIDLAGNAYVSGFSYSSDFPTTAGVYLSGRAIGGPVVAKINPAGTQLVWATYLDLNSGRSGLDVDAAGAVYVASGPAVVKLSVDGGSLLYRGVFGQESDITYDLAADSQGSVWAVGQNDGGFIRKISQDGSTLVFAMEFGQDRPSYDVASRVAVDAVDRVYVSGVWAQLAVTPEALLPNPPDTYAPGFLSVFNPDGTVAYASYTPKPFRALTIDSSGQVYGTDGTSVTKTDLRRP